MGKWPRVGMESQRSTTPKQNAPPYREVPTLTMEGWLYTLQSSQANKAKPSKRVSFCNPENEDSAAEGRNPLAEPSINDLETWLDYQVRQLCTPTWWKELEAIPGITDLHRFAQKIRVSFYVPEVQSRIFLEEGYSMPPAPPKSE